MCVRLSSKRASRISSASRWECDAVTWLRSQLSTALLRSPAPLARRTLLDSVVWYVFPQISGLGFSGMSQRYSISPVDEANAYLQHPVLGRRLIQCIDIVLALNDKSAEQVFGHLDSLKFKSCMTLFAFASNNQIFNNAIEKYFDGKLDHLTIRALEAHTN